MWKGIAYLLRAKELFGVNCVARAAQMCLTSAQ